MPERTCVTCRSKKAKSELVRIVRSPFNQEIFIDFSGRAEGRGAYVCDLNCLKKSSSKKLLSRALKIEIGSDKIAELIATLDNFEKVRV